MSDPATPTHIVLWFLMMMHCEPGTVPSQAGCTLEVHESPFDSSDACTTYGNSLAEVRNLNKTTISVCSNWQVPVSTE